MDSTISTAKLMQNFTICLAPGIREHLGVGKGDHLILQIQEDGKVRLMKAVSDLDELIGIGKKSFKRLGGGESFLSKERQQWRK